MNDWTERQYQEPGKIGSLTFGDDRQAAWINVEGEAWGQSFGGIAGPPTRRTDFLRSICLVFGVASPELLVGQPCVALRAFPGEQIMGLRSVTTGRTFSLREYLRSRGFHVDDDLTEMLRDIDRDISSAKLRIAALDAKRTRVAAGCRPVTGEAP